MGRDFQVRVLQGGRPVFIVGSAVGIAAVIAAFILGALGGIFPGILGILPNLFLNVYILTWSAFAPLPFLLLLMSAVPFDLSTTPYILLITYLTLFMMPLMIPLVRAKFIAMRAGYSQSLLPLLGYVFLGAMVRAILLFAALDFLGLGTQPPTPSWGNLLSQSRQFLQVAPYLLVPPGIFLTITIFCLTGGGSALGGHL